MHFSVVGMGYVGLSLSVLISQKHSVEVIDTDINKIESINKRISPINDHDIDHFFKKKKLNLTATIDKNESYQKSDFVIICTPTNFDKNTGSFDTSLVTKVINEVIKANSNACIVIKSTVPVGFTDTMRKQYNSDKIFFSPEFLREGKALYDNLYPSRIVVGDRTEKGNIFANILAECASQKIEEIPILRVESREAEAIKLFANTYLAMRVSFFNELDSFSEINNLSSVRIIEGVSLDPRIGKYYNNPSFGYGGYCLPKDTKELLKNYETIPNKIIKAVVEANDIRKEFIVDSISRKQPKKIGIYRLTMKKDSDNFRESAVIDITKRLIKRKFDILVYEPSIKNLDLEGTTLINNFSSFVESSDLIIANRISEQLKQCMEKVYTRDIFLDN